MKIKTPGDVILNDSLKHLKIGQSAFAEAMGMSSASISRILAGKAAITPETALRLEVVLNEPAAYWLNLQAEYDIETLRKSSGFDLSGLKQLESIPGATLAMDMLRQMFHKYRAPDAKIPTEEIRDVCRICNVENMYRLMRRVDPTREVFDYPYEPGETGLNGLTRLDDAYDHCSDYFGEYFMAEDQVFPEKLLAAYDSNLRGSKHESVYRSGNLAWNKLENVPGYLVKLYLGNMGAPDTKDLDALRKRFPDLGCYFKEKERGSPDSLVLTVFLRTAKELANVPKIYDALEKYAQKWMRKSVKPHGRDRTFD